ncbi:unnamed protein product [Agarophyton chilense]
MPPSSTRLEALPSACIEKALVWLLGLSYGEHDDGAQRLSISRKLGEIINAWVSGLLAADFPVEEVENTFCAFSKFMHSDIVQELVNWSAISVTDVDQLIHIHWVRASQNMIDLPLPPAKPLETAIDSLSVALNLLDCIAAKENRRSAAANTAPGHLIFSAVRILISTTDENDQRSSKVRNLCDQSLSQLCRMRRLESKSQLLSSLLTQVAPLIRIAVKGDLSSFKAPYSVHHVAPTSHVLHYLLSEVGDNKLIETVNEILPTLRDLVESVQESIRVQALHSMALLSSRLPLSAMEPIVTSKSLQVALSWRDVPTSMVAIPLLATLLPKTRPIESRGEEFFTSVSKVIGTVVHHMQSRSESSESDDQGLQALGETRAAIELSRFVPPLVQDLLMCRIDWILALCTFLERIAILVRHGTLEAEDVTRTLAVLKESIKWAWLRVDSFRKNVFESCLSVLMETRRVPDSFLIQAAIRDMILQVAKCGQVERLIEMIQEVRACAKDYSSLETAVELCKELEDIIAFEGEATFKTSIHAGSSVQRFFPELA